MKAVTSKVTKKRKNERDLPSMPTNNVAAPVTTSKDFAVSQETTDQMTTGNYNIFVSILLAKWCKPVFVNCLSVCLHLCWCKNCIFCNISLRSKSRLSYKWALYLNYLTVKHDESLMMKVHVHPQIYGKIFLKYFNCHLMILLLQINDNVFIA